MSIASNFTKLRETFGIEGVVLHVGETQDFRTDVANHVDWIAPVMHDAIAMMPDDIDEFRLVFKSNGKNQAVLVARQGDEVVAVAYPNGHEVAKSLHRLLRRMSKSERHGGQQKPRTVPTGSVSEDVAA